MRLLNTESLRLESFFGLSTPEYAILSHTWGEDEVLFNDIRDPAQSLPTRKKGFAKVKGSCVQAQRDGYGYIWIDTCCIDKSSSAELSEAINSMFQWYYNSDRCYAYLADVDSSKTGRVADLTKSRWFTRGWTLQELIAPRDLRFFDRNWSFLGRRRANGENAGNSNPDDGEDLADKISQATGVPVEVLHWYPPQHVPSRMSGSESWIIPSAMWDPTRSNPAKYADSVALTRALNSFSIAQKMSWAARRLTTRLEDQAYSLLGLFGVNMPLLYGEGRRAFFRLQEELLRTSNDQSILAFVPYSLEGQPCSLLADSPLCFVDSEVQPPTRNHPVWPGPGDRGSLSGAVLSPSPKTLEIGLCLCPASSASPLAPGRRLFYGILNCVYRNDSTSHPAILLEVVGEGKRSFARIAGPSLRRVSPLDVDQDSLQVVQSNGRHTDMLPNLSQASFETVHLYYHPPDLHSIWAAPTGPELENPPPGMKIKFNGGKWFSPFQLGSYPQRAQLDDRIPDPQIYIPSGDARYLLKSQRQVHVGKDNGVDVHLWQDPATPFPFGVVILRSSILGTLVFSWGNPPTTREEKPWFAVFGWNRMAEACGLSQDPHSELDLVAAARAMFENQDSWMPLVNTFPAPVVQHDESLLGKIWFVVDEKSFFGRRFLSVDMTLPALESKKMLERQLPRIQITSPSD